MTQKRVKVKSRANLIPQEGNAVHLEKPCYRGMPKNIMEERKRMEGVTILSEHWQPVFNIKLICKAFNFVLMD